MSSVSPVIAISVNSRVSEDSPSLPNTCTGLGLDLQYMTEIRATTVRRQRRWSCLGKAAVAGQAGQAVSKATTLE